MGERSSIEWTHHTFNPWRGCAHAQFPGGREHPGCGHCYAESGWGRRFGVRWGSVAEGGTREVAADSTWAQPLAWAKRAALHGVRERVFCASLADVLEEDVPPEAQARLWNLIRSTAVMGGDHLHPRPPREGESGLDWLLLTKRPERWQLVPEDVRPLVWLGTSVSDQATADEWVPRLLHAQGFRLRFLSCEPLVGPVDLSRWLWADLGESGRARLGQLGWVIAGGESGHGARPMHPAWALQLRDQCQAAAVPFHFKQWGEWAAIDQPWKQEGPAPLADNERWLNVLGGHGFHGEEVWRERRVGKKASGRELDGRTWDEVPR